MNRKQRRRLAKKAETVGGDSLGPCPECGKEVYATIDASKKNPELRYGGLIHEHPACQRFMDMDVLDFVTWMRMVKEAGTRKPGAA